MSNTHTVLLRPRYNRFEDFQEVKENFYSGDYYLQISDSGAILNHFVTVYDFPVGTNIKIRYNKTVDDFNFGDRNVIDRTMSIMFKIEDREMVTI